MNKERLRSFISLIFTFFLAFFMFVIVLLTTTRFTIMSPANFMNKMESVDFYNNTVTELNRAIKQNAAPSGFPLEMFENYVKEEDIREDMITYTKDRIAGKNVEIPTKEFRDRLVSDTDKYIKDNNIQMTDATKKGVTSFIDTSVSKYSYLTQFPYIEYYGQVTSLFSKGFLIGLPVMLVVSGILAFLLARLHVSRRKRRRYYAYGFIGAGLLTSALPIYLYVVNFFERINLKPQYLYNLLVSLTKSYLIINIVAGLALIIVGVIITILKVKKKHKKGKHKVSYRIYHDTVKQNGFERE